MNTFLPAVDAKGDGAADGVEGESDGAKVAVTTIELMRSTDEEKAAARKTAMLASRTNFVLSIPMLLCMGSATHGLPF